MKTLSTLTAAAAIAAAIGAFAPAQAGNYGGYGYTSNYNTNTYAATQYCYRQVWNGYRWVTQKYVCSHNGY